MENIEEIEKRRRELRYINYAIICLLTLAVLILFLFVDEVAGLFGALKYNQLLRIYFFGFIISSILYLGQKEKQQAKLTNRLLNEMRNTSTTLAKELRHKEFLSQVSFMVTNLRDNSVLRLLFEATIKFFQADGGAVVLRDKRHGPWNKPLIAYPNDYKQETIDFITNLIGKNGRSFIQPDDEFPDYQPLKEVANIIAVPLRLESRIYGLIVVWSSSNIVYDRTDLEVLETIAREAANSAFALQLIEQKESLHKGLLRLISKTVDDHTKRKNRALRVSQQARILAEQLDLSPETVEAIEIAATLQNIDKVIGNGNGQKKKKSSQSAKILKSLKFPKQVTEILAAKKSSGKSALPGARVLAVAEAYVDKAYPKRGRGPSPDTIASFLESEPSGVYDKQVLGALRQLIASVDNQLDVSE